MAPLSLLPFLLLAAFAVATDEPDAFIRRQLIADPDGFELPDDFILEPTSRGVSELVSKRLRCSYVALRAWKRAIWSDPHNFTGNWEGPDVCSYNGVFCTKALDDPSADVVGGVDLNNADLRGHLPLELGLMRDLSLLHINSNRFNGTIPDSISRFKLIHELDFSNNRLSGPFPPALLSLPTLRYLDLRFNRLSGPLPAALFDRPLDALFLNNNRFSGPIPPNFSSAPLSVAVLAHNSLSGPLPSLTRMASTLNELILQDNDLSGCLPPDLGQLSSTTVIDLSYNSFSGLLPGSLSGLTAIEELDVGHNSLSGAMPATVCGLRTLQNLTFSYNFFTKLSRECVRRERGELTMDDRGNCLDGRLKQRTVEACVAAAAKRPPAECARHVPLRRLGEEFVVPEVAGFVYASPPPPLMPVR